MNANGTDERPLVEQPLSTGLVENPSDEILDRRAGSSGTGPMPIVSLGLETGAEEPLASPEGLDRWDVPGRRESPDWYRGAGGPRAGATL